MRRFSLSFLFLFTLSSLFSLTWLEGDFHINKDFTYFYSERSDFPHPPPAEWYLTTGQKNLYHALMEDVHYLYSFMIYGAQFTYIPGDTQDGVEDRFTMELLHQIPWGDPQLSVTDLWYEGDELFIHTRYRLNESQSRRLEALKSSVYPVSGGWGESTSLEDRGRIKAVEAAVRQSVRNYWQPREYSRPRELSGQVFLREFPRFGIVHGNHRASIMGRFRFDSPVPYP
jgi:hypothetical protein